MPTLPSITVVTPSYNQGRYVERTILSVLSQDYPDLQYIVCDARSTDETPAILQRYADQLTAIVEKDAGQSDAVNKGIAKAAGEIIGWLNSDDTYAAGALRSIGAYFAANPEVDVVYGNADYIDVDDRFIADCAHVEPWSHHRLIHYSDFIVQPACFFRKAAFDAVGGLDVTLHYAMDYDLWLRLAAAGGRFAYLPQKLAHYRWVGANKSATGGMDRLSELRQLGVRHGAGGLPAYCKLELINLRIGEAASLAKAVHPLRAAGKFASATGVLLTSPRGMASMFRPQVWRTILIGRKLRAAVVAGHMMETPRP
ncbi:MAG TPA: glycosyltransferase family 2 protein [Tepidisphaeraceae bacterium]|jgi:GT2 family glycosyltransferase|nr:glycosyltransferase family 2 protein [Tepidisphaeraceae bacterium]